MVVSLPATLPPEKIIILQAVGALRDGVVTGNSQKLSDGWVTLAGPRPHTSGGNAALAVILEIRDNEGGLVESYGPYYARNGAATVARPNLRVYAGWTARIVACGSTSFTATGTAEGIVILSTTQPVGAGVIPPWEGPHNSLHDEASIQTADPAAGANPAQQTVGARSRERLIGVDAQLVTDATAGNRHAMVTYDGGVGDARFATAIAAAPQAASATHNYSGGLNGSLPSSTAIVAGVNGQIRNFIAVCDFIMAPADRYQLVADNIQAGDNWGVASFDIQRWAAFQ